MTQIGGWTGTDGAMKRPGFLNARHRLGCAFGCVLYRTVLRYCAGGGGIVATRLTLTLTPAMNVFDEKPISIAVNGVGRR